MKGKGITKRRKSQFKLGHTFNETYLHQASASSPTVDLDISNPHDPHDEGQSEIAHHPVTRSQSWTEKTPGKSTDDEYFIAHKGKLEIMNNDSFSAHLEKSPACKGFLHLKKTEQRSVFNCSEICL